MSLESPPPNRGAAQRAASAPPASANSRPKIRRGSTTSIPTYSSQPPKQDLLSRQLPADCKKYTVAFGRCVEWEKTPLGMPRLSRKELLKRSRSTGPERRNPERAAGMRHGPHVWKAGPPDKERKRVAERPRSAERVRQKECVERRVAATRDATLVPYGYGMAGRPSVPSFQPRVTQQRSAIVSKAPPPPLQQPQQQPQQQQRPISKVPPFHPPLIHCPLPNPRPPFFYMPYSPLPPLPIHTPPLQSFLPRSPNTPQPFFHSYVGAPAPRPSQKVISLPATPFYAYGPPTVEPPPQQTDSDPLNIDITIRTERSARRLEKERRDKEDRDKLRLRLALVRNRRRSLVHRSKSLSLVTDPTQHQSQQQQEGEKAAQPKQRLITRESTKDTLSRRRASRDDESVDRQVSAAGDLAPCPMGFEGSKGEYGNLLAHFLSSLSPDVLTARRANSPPGAQAQMEDSATQTSPVPLFDVRDKQSPLSMAAALCTHNTPIAK